LARFVTMWNGLSGRSDNAGDPLHYIVTQRKQGLWVTFGGTYQRLHTMPEDFLSPEEWVALEVVYEETLVALNVGSDNLGFDEQLAARVSDDFFRRTGRVVLPLGSKQ
jgi:hypothetical protein